MITLTTMQFIHTCKQVKQHRHLFKMFSSKQDEILSEPKTCDLIGKPDVVSNLRPYKFFIHENESNLEKYYRMEREKIQNWNQEFWSKHNKKFIKERELYIQDIKLKLSQNQNISPDDVVVTADEMSVFYKQFLDKHWYIHLHYNIEWYKKNIHLIILAIQTNLYQIVKLFKKK